MSNTTIPIEDDPCDIITKAMRGQNLSTEQLADKAGMDIEVLQDLLAGGNTPTDIKRVAKLLKLDGGALSNLSNYYPSIEAPKGLHQIISPFGHAGVNAYIIEHGTTATVIDTGTNADELIQLLHSKGLKIARLLITHRHHDHTACTEAFKNTPILYPEDLEHKALIKTENGTITSLDVSGHMSPARAFYYEGLETPICIVGDAVFAGSMGGTSGASTYKLSLKTAQNNLMTLPYTTVLCPGHGPLTSVRLEQKNNPFLSKC